LSWLSRFVGRRRGPAPVADAPVVEVSPRDAAGRAASALLAAHPLGALKAIADRAIAGLEPTFVGLAAGWREGVAPRRALMSVIAMAYSDAGAGEGGARAIAATPLLRAFVDLAPDERPLDPTALAAGQARLIRNVSARSFVSSVVAAARASGLTGAGGLVENAALIESWTFGTGPHAPPAS
jgi:hypothetical protein